MHPPELACTETSMHVHMCTQAGCTVKSECNIAYTTWQCPSHCTSSLAPG